ncbi:conserved hypothetical protein [Ricinus communis]|uniref:Uncharacterized protein n=1 Tax=Ricinus communis TaxID=3988 RepID=B9TB18_RICCO|nr:conserved hypothetical protein [Ricinus communis]
MISRITTIRPRADQGQNQDDQNNSTHGILLVISRGEGLVAIQAAVDQAHTVADAQVVYAVLLDDAGVAVIHAHGDLVFLLAGVAVAFDIVADHRAADGAGRRGHRAAAAAAHLVTQQATNQAASDRADAGGAARLHHHDLVDGAVGGRVVADVADLLRLLVAGAAAQCGDAGQHGGGKHS